MKLEVGNGFNDVQLMFDYSNLGDRMKNFELSSVRISKKFSLLKWQKKNSFIEIYEKSMHCNIEKMNIRIDNSKLLTNRL